VGNYTTGVFGCIQIVVHFMGKIIVPPPPPPKVSNDWFKKIIPPSVILIIASWLHFWVNGTWSVPRSISASIPFVIFVCLLLFFHIESCDLLTWLLVCTLFTFFSLIEYFLVICFGTTVRRTRLHTSPMTATTATEYGQLPKQTYIIENEERSVFEAGRKTKCSEISSSKIDVFSRIIFPICFFIFFGFYYFFIVDI